MKAIRTKYYGPGNVRGSRIMATDDDGNRVYIPYPYELDSDDAHLLAARALCRKMGWEGVLARGAIRDGYVFVWCGRPEDRFNTSGEPVRSYAG